LHLLGKIFIFRLLQQKQIITQQMQNKSNKTMEFKAGKADKDFTEERLINYTGLRGFKIHLGTGHWEPV